MNKDESYKKIEYAADRDTKLKYWNIALGLQAVDDLKPSKYLIELAQSNIDGEITNQEIEDLLYSHYKNETNEQRLERTKECDVVSNRITELLNNEGLAINPGSLKAIHKYLFKDIYENAGEYRTYNISKEEPVLNNRTVKYANYFQIEDMLEYDFNTEKKQKYATMNEQGVIRRISEFTSGIWQIHPFMEGNTRTTAIFIERYLNSIGFNVNNELFKENSKYFRNALVRSNYADYQNGIDTSHVFLEKFFENLLFKGENILQSRDLIVKQYFNENLQVRQKSHDMDLER